MTDPSLPITFQSVILPLSILSLPLLSAFISFLFGKKSPRGIPVLSTILMIVSVISTFVLYLRGYNAPIVNESILWFTIGDTSLWVGFLLDYHSIPMILMVTLISMLVHLYSIGYMADDPNKASYFGLLGFFTFSMTGLIFSNNLLLLFCFWELVGFSSYRLIGFYKEKPTAAPAATKAFIMNRVGDLGFLLGLMIVWSNSKTFDIATLSSLDSSIWTTPASICFFLGVIGKSAQFPLFTWLPDAMEAPTPISALIHAATMVVAGIYLLLRIDFMFTPTALTLVAYTGATTAFLAGLAALFSYDIKRILAYSTISQLGFMVLAIGIGSNASFLHLLNHAFFKAGLFLGAGTIIYSLHHLKHDKTFDYQDIRNMGGLAHQMPLVAFAFIVCAAALSGLPFTSGFESKDAILSQLNSWSSENLLTRWPVVLLSWGMALLTPLYSFRLVWYVFFGTASSEVRKAPLVMVLPVFLLAALSITLAISMAPLRISSWMAEVLFLENIEASSTATYLAVSIVCIGLAIGYFMYRKKRSPVFHSFLGENFYLDKLYNQFILVPIRTLSVVTETIDSKVIDRTIHSLVFFQVSFSHLIAWIDTSIVDGIVGGTVKIARGIGSLSRQMVMGKIQTYILWSTLGLIIFMLWILL